MLQGWRIDASILETILFQPMGEQNIYINDYASITKI